MRILCITPWFPRHRQDQRGNFILDSIESLIDLGHEVTVLITQPWRPRVAGLISKDWVRKKTYKEQFSSKISVYYCYHLSIPRSCFCSFSHWLYRKKVNPILEKLALQYNCQLIHAHTELAGVSAVDVGSKLGLPTVISLHGISTEKKLYLGNTKKLLFEYTLSGASRVVLVGNPLVSFAKKFIKDHGHFRIVHNGFRASLTNVLGARRSWSDKYLRFISVSNLLEGKGVDLNLYALAKLKEMGFSDWIYNIVGDGAERKKLEELVSVLKLNRHVIFLGACDHNEVYEHLSQADIFTLPSYREAFGVAYLEAMSCGLLTIGIEGQGPQEYIEHEKTGLLVPPRDITSLAIYFKSIFESPEKMHKIAEAGKEYVHAHFTWCCHARRLVKIYNELVSE